MCLGRRTWKELGKEVESTGSERRTGQGVWKEGWKEALKEGGSGGRGERIAIVGTEGSRFYSGWNWKPLDELRQGVKWLWLIFALKISLWLLGTLVACGGDGGGERQKWKQGDRVMKVFILHRQVMPLLPLWFHLNIMKLCYLMLLIPQRPTGLRLWFERK